MKLIQIIRRLISGRFKRKTLAQTARSGAMRAVRHANKVTRTRSRPRPYFGAPRPLGLAKGTPNKSIIKSYVLNGVQFELHATKGWRHRRYS